MSIAHRELSTKYISQECDTACKLPPSPPKTFPASYRCMFNTFKKQKKVNLIALFRILKILLSQKRKMDSCEAQKNLVDNKTIFFRAKDCGICGPFCVCAQLTTWTQLLRPLPHSLLQIHTPHLPHEIEVWALKLPICLCQHALLGLYFLDKQSWMASLLC